MKYLSFTLPGGTQVEAPSGIPTDAGPFAQNLIRIAINFSFFFAIVFALFMLIWGGFRWMMSGGDKEKLEQAKQTLIYAIIGLVLVFLSFFVINLIGQFFNLNLVGFSTTGANCRARGDC